MILQILDGYPSSFSWNCLTQKETKFQLILYFLFQEIIDHKLAKCKRVENSKINLFEIFEYAYNYYHITQFAMYITPYCHYAQFHILQKQDYFTQMYKKYLRCALIILSLNLSESQRMRIRILDLFARYAIVKLQP